MLCDILKFTYENMIFDYLIVIMNESDDVDISKIYNLDEKYTYFREHFIHGKYNNEPYFIIDMLSLKVKFHRKHVVKNNCLLDDILNEVIILLN